MLLNQLHNRLDLLLVDYMFPSMPLVMLQPSSLLLLWGRERTDSKSAESTTRSSFLVTRRESTGSTFSDAGSTCALASGSPRWERRFLYGWWLAFFLWLLSGLAWLLVPGLLSFLLFCLSLLFWLPRELWWLCSWTRRPKPKRVRWNRFSWLRQTKKGRSWSIPIHSFHFLTHSLWLL